MSNCRKCFDRAPLFFCVLTMFWNFFSEYAFAVSDVERLRLTFDIKPAFVVQAISRDGVSAVELDPVVLEAEYPVDDLEVSIQTNTNRRYRVYHEMGEPVSDDGATFPEKGMLFMVSQGTQGGASAIRSFRKIPQDRHLIFTSRHEGGSDTFMIQYMVAHEPIFEAGNYFGTIRLIVENN
jgi:hypothetical protein